MTPLLTTEAAWGLLSRHRRDGSHRPLFLGVTTSNILNIPAATKLLYNIELCKKGSHRPLFLGTTTSNILNIPAATKLLYNIELCKKLCSRNSFFNVLKPDMTKVELLKDVNTKKELVVRLVAHNIGPYDEDNDIKEEVIKAEPCKLLIAEKTCLERCCGSCTGGDSTKTKKSQKASKNTQKEKGGDVSYLNKNSCASCADKNGENRDCIIGVLHYMNSDPVNEDSPRGLNSNANSVTCEAGYQSDVSRRCFALDSSLSRCSLKTSHVESSKTSLLKRRGPHILQYPLMSSFQQMPHSSSVGNKCHLPFRRKDLKSNLITAKVEPQTGKQRLPYLPVRVFQPFPQCSRIVNKWCLPMRRKDAQCNKMSSETEAGK